MLQAEVARRVDPTARAHTHRFQVAMALALSAVAVVGFWPTFFGPLVRGAANRHWILNLHGAVFTGWLILLVAQVTLAARGRLAMHRRLGAFGIAYGCLVLLAGVVVSFAAPLLRVAAGEWSLDRAAGFLVVPLGDMVLFAGFFGAAIAWRRKPDMHKRLMLFATVTLLFAAVGRMTFLSMPAMFGVWLAPVLVGMAHDLVTRRSIHKVYVVGLAVLLLGLLRLPLEQSPAWISVGRSALDALK